MAKAKKISGKVVEENQWEYLTYTVGEHKLDEKKGGRADIIWPDGNVEAVRFESQYDPTTVQDMGHSYSVPRHKLMVVVDYHERKLYTPLAGLEVEDVEQD